MCKIYYEQETPNEKACCRCDEEPESPSKKACGRCIMNGNRHMTLPVNEDI